MRTSPVLACAACLLAACLPAAIRADEPAASPPGAGPDEAARIRHFEARVRPLLVERCHKCHGPDKQQGGLRLDSRAAALTGGDSGPAVEPGRPDDSLLLEAVERTGSLKMPPDEPLPPDAVRELRQWIADGAVWPDAPQLARSATSPESIAAARASHWAFQPLVAPPLPPVAKTDWPRTPLDRFVLARIEREGLAPAPAADRRTWLRRVTVALTGLPPTYADVRAFEQDGSPEARERVVDRLLASPHYGERWARVWLDVARYADNKGYVFFQDGGYPWAWTYRDYVIRAFNDDLPYDRFVREQLAADQLVNAGAADRRALTALGFLTVGGRFMNNPHDIIDDRIDVVTRGLQGLTVTCARCHDHKFDPIPSADYYSLYGVFLNSIEPDVPPLFAPPPDTPEYRAFDEELRKREAALTDFVRANYESVVRGARERAAEYLLAAHAIRNQPRQDDFMLLADGGDLNPKMVVRWQVYLAQTRRNKDPIWVPWHAYAELSEEKFAEQSPQTTLAFSSPADAAGRPAVPPLVLELFAGKPPESMKDVAERYAGLLLRIEREWQTSGAAGAPLDDPEREALRQVFYGPDAPPSIGFNPFGDLDLFPDREGQQKLEKLRKEVAEHREKGAGAPPRAMALADAASITEPRLFLRGNPNQLGPFVPRRYLEIASPPERPAFVHGAGRLDLAEAIVARSNPLTARVFVNRVWLAWFGKGLVRTPGDFGLRSDPPSHPELLDHLAARFRDGGWSLKALQREIALSATAAQSSLPTPDAAARDPENLLYTRMTRRRLDFEGVRDALVTAGGEWDRFIGGPSVNLLAAPYPLRRAVYGHVDRLALPGLLRTFDYPSPDATSPQRDETTTAPQALFLMNHPFARESARRILQRNDVAAAQGAPARIETLFRAILQRDPTDREQALTERFLQTASEARGAAAPDEEAWLQAVHGLLLLNEFVFID